MAVNIDNNWLRVPFGLKLGRLLRPQDTERGLACDCVCPGCGSTLIANQGDHKRPYFSHYQSRECAGGYESALHLMAKQIIEDHRYIVVPEFRQSISRTIPTGDVLSEEVVVPSKRLEFVDVRVEESVDGLRPDLIGVTSDGAEVLIEVYVSHAVTDEKRKRFAKKSLIELDLSKLPQDLVADTKLFAEMVLSGAGREWVSCQLYHEEIKAARQALTQKVKQFIAEHRSRVEQAKIERQAEAKRLKRETEIADRKSQSREQYSRHLEQLLSHTVYRRYQDQGLESGEKRDIAHSVGCEQLPVALAYEQKDDWIFISHRTLWQAFIYKRFIEGQPQNILRANDIKRAVVRQFGLLDWIKELINLKYQHKVQGRSRRQWYGKKGVWFFTDAENRMIPSPYLLVLDYLKSLAREGMLKIEHPDRDSFTVKFDSFVALESYKAEQAEQARLAEVERQKAAHEAEVERRQIYTEESDKRIDYLISEVDSLYKKGERDVRRCDHCSHFQMLTDGDYCLECNCPMLWNVTLSISYLETLPYRLRSLQLFPSATKSDRN